MSMNLIKDNYNYKKVNLKDGTYLDINVKLNLPKTPITKDKETDIKYLKVLLAEGIEMTKAESNDKDTDKRFKNIFNAKILVNFIKPTCLYTLVILYKRITRGKFLEANSRKENLKIRIKGIAAISLLGFLYFNLFNIVQNGLILDREDYLKEILGSAESVDEYERFKQNYLTRQI